MSATAIEVIPVIGYGPIGRETTRLLLEKGYHVRVVQRREPEDLPDGATFTKADAMESTQLARAIDGTRTIVFALGLPYDGKTWAEGWPKAMTAVLTACEQAGARMVYADSLYLYGPQDQPLTETLPAVDYGLKPTARSAATRLWQKAFDDGRVKTAAVRAPDFFGPGVLTSVLGAATLGRMAQGKSARILISADHPHDIVHIADFARAIVTLVEAPDDAYGQAWHVPTPPTKTLREILTIAATAMDVPVRISVISSGFAKILGLFMPQVREAVELHYLFDRPYFVDSEKFRERFWSDVEPLERSIADTARSYLSGKN
ncbi:MAG: NAD-dependent epimerase/dehydratase family protein [Parvibaculaceae bacterium]|jgi:nucleoside-diphosphate-sugar epimerase